MAVRTKRLVGPTTVTNTVAIVYTCPANKTALIKNIMIADQGSTATIMRFFIGTNTLPNRILQIDTNPGGTVTWNPTFIVLAAGEVLRAQLAAAGNFTLTAHGAELDGVA